MRIRRNKSGFTLAEILVSMAITAALLTAVAAALHASINSYQENQKIAAATQTARTVLSRMMRDIRTADAVETTSFSVTIIPPSNPDGLQMIRYESPYDGKLHYYRTVNGDTSEYILIGDEEPISVESFYVSGEKAQDGEGVWYTTRVSAQLRLYVGDNFFFVSASACPRRNQEY